jgi:DNA-directed RNA polymerase subunit beta
MEPFAPLGVDPPSPGRRFDDFGQTRKHVYDNVLSAASAIKPVEAAGRRLEISNVAYDPKDDDDDENERFSIASQAKAVRERTTLGRRLRGTVRMVDTATGNVLEESRKLLAVVPRFNEDGTMIYRGARYNVVNQQRLKPGIYGRVKRNGETESHVNPRQGTGSMHRYIFNPESGVFSLNIRNSKIPLVPLLRTLGVSDDEITTAWGEEIAKKNFAKKDQGSLDKLYERLVPSKERLPDANKEYKQIAIRKAIGDVRLDQWTMKSLLDEDSDRLTPMAILKATAKTLAMARGDQEADDRDHLAYQSVLGPEDYFAERINKDSGYQQRNAFRKALYRGKLASLPTKSLQGQLESVIFGSGVGVQPEYANPLDALGRATRVTKMGDGAIGSSNAAPMESRDFHASHQGFIDPGLTVESLKVGLDLNFAAGAIKGKDGKLYTRLLNARTGQPEYVSTEQASQSTIAFQGADTEVPGYLLVNRKGQEDFARPDDVDYVMPDSSEATFSDISNLVPMKGYMPQGRLAMSSRFLEQSLPLVNREAPLVQVAVPGSDKRESFQQRYAEKVGAIKSKMAGQVLSVAKDAITLQTANGPRKVNLHVDTPLGSKTSLNSRPVVQVGDVVKPGQLLAASNFTDDKGTMAMGLNARMALAPWGDNYEDAYTISESFAKRMASEHSYDFARDHEEDKRVSTRDFMSAMPREYTKEQLAKFDDDGVIRVGERVSQGDPVLLSAGMRSANMAKSLARSGGQKFTNASQTWEHEEPGIVTGVHRAKNGRSIVTVGGAFPLIDADKIAEVAGTKGVVKIIPDDQMLQDKDGKPFDVVSSDLGVISRKNSSRVIAMALGKAAQARGEAYNLEEMEPDFDMVGFAQGELKKYGLTDTETVIDPQTGRKIEGVMTGPQFMMKLHHISESKSHGRGVGAYSSDDSPAKGSEEGLQAKRLSNQELGAMVAHGGFEYLREGALVRGQRNDEYWARFANGQDLPTPKVPMVYEKFIGYLKGMGVNPVRTGMKTKLMLLTDKDALDLSGGRQLKSGETVDMQRDLQPIKGGLFDKAIFGDDGKQFATYELAQAIPHPLMEDAVRTLMGVTKKSYENILKGEEDFQQLGSGPQAVGKWLSKLDPVKELGVARRQAQDARKTKREAAVKRVRFLRGLTDRNIDPSTLMLQQIPIIPPIYRPVSKLEGKNTPLIDGMNLLYREMLSADDSYRKVTQFAGKAPEEQLAVYESVKAAMGLRQPLDPELQQKSVTGIMARLTGSSPKHSYVSRKLLSGTVDSVGRGVVLPSADLGLDEIGIPEEQAWSIYKMPVMRNLRKRGMPLAAALEAIKHRAPAAVKAMDEEMSHRPVVASRAPVLHKYGNMAFMPKLVRGHALHMNPLIHAGYGLDHDGDEIIGSVIIAIEQSQYSFMKEVIQFRQAEMRHAGTLAVKTKKGLGSDAVDVIVEDTEPCQAVSLTPYLMEIDMASFTKTQLPILQDAPKLQDHVVLHVDLSEFPVSDCWRTTQGRCGAVHWHKPLVDTKVLAVHPETGSLDWVEVSDWTRHSGCEVEIVTLSSKRQIFTDNDPRGLAVVRPGESLDLQPHKPYIAFKNKCLVPRVAKFVPTGPQTDVLDMGPYIEMGEAQSRVHKLPNSLVVERDLDSDFGWFCGAMASDGWAGDNYAVCLAKSHEPTRRNWERIVRTLLDGELEFHEYFREKGEAAVQNAYGATARINVISKHLSCLTWEFFGDGAVNKHLPAFYMNTPEDFRAGILVALLDTDATVNVNTTKAKPQLACWFNSCSLRLCREVVTLSMSIGVRAKVRWSKSTEIGTDAWVVEWSAADLQKLVRKYGHLMVNDERMGKILSTPVNDEMSGVGPATRADAIPITYKLAATLRTKLGMPKDHSKATPEHRSTYTALQGAAKKGFISRYAAMSIAAPLFDEDWLAKQHEWEKFVKWRANTAIVWDTIEDFERTGKAEVGYDLTVPGYENWMTAEGIIVPNTMNFHALITEEAISEAKEKLLPSKSLISPKDFKTPMFVPRQDHALGIYLASTAKDDTHPRVFATKQDAMRAFKRGEINAGTPIKVLEK